MENTTREQNAHLVKDTVSEILRKMGIVFEIDISDDEDIGAVIFSITTDDSKLLIGYRGANLHALSHLVRRIVEQKKPNNPFYFIIDVNDYHRKKIEELKTNAKMLAERARFFKSSVEMNPLPAYERLVVHSFFAHLDDFETKSHGEGKNRKVVITYTGD